MYRREANGCNVFLYNINSSRSLIVMRHSRAESDGIISVETRVARPERGARRLVVSISVRVGAVTLCKKRA